MQIGLIASERQAIHACLRSVSSEDARFRPLADRYWVARGGSHTDGGAFRFAVSASKPGEATGSHTLSCTDKFGAPVRVNPTLRHSPPGTDAALASAEFRSAWENQLLRAYDDGGSASAWNSIGAQLATLDWNALAWGADWLAEFGENGPGEWGFARDLLTLMRDQKGRELFTSGALGTNGVACAQCHPNGANTHPETYPKFQKQLGRVIALREMINWCLQQPLEGKPLALDAPDMIALEAYIHHERRGVKLAPGKH